jgi:hypothetical protein
MMYDALAITYARQVSNLKFAGSCAERKVYALGLRRKVFRV